MRGKYSSLIIQALEELDLKEISPGMEQKLHDLVSKETDEDLFFDLKLASVKVHDYIIQLLKRKKNDRLALA